jgi:hypothetical protein
MEKSFLIDQIWSNRAVLKYKDSKTNLGTLEVSELESMYALIPTTNATQELDDTVQPDAPSSNIGTVVNNKGVEIPVVYLPLAKVSGMSLYFQFGEQFVIVSNIEYVMSFNKGLIQLGELMPFNFNLGINSFAVGIGGHLQAIAQTVTVEERNALTNDEKLAGKLLTSFVAGFASEQAVAKEKSMQIAMIKAEAVHGLKGAERKAVQAEITTQIVDIKVSQVSSKLKALFAI